MVGLTVGLAGGILAARLIPNLLYGVRPLDGNLFLVVALLLVLTAVVACIQPAWRASHLNPMEAGSLGRVMP